MNLILFFKICNWISIVKGTCSWPEPRHKRCIHCRANQFFPHLLVWSLFQMEFRNLQYQLFLPDPERFCRHLLWNVYQQAVFLYNLLCGVHTWKNVKLLISLIHINTKTQLWNFLIIWYLINTGLKSSRSETFKPKQLVM